MFSQIEIIVAEEKGSGDGYAKSRLSTTEEAFLTSKRRWRWLLFVVI
jgi:hypothetical protein